MSKYLISSFILTGFEPLARKYRLNASDLIRSMGLPISLVHNQNILLDHTAAARLLNNAAILSHQPMFGLQMANYVGVKDLGALGMYFSHQPSLGHMYPMMERLHAMRASVSPHTLRCQGDQAFHTVNFGNEDDATYDQLLVLTLGSVHRMLDELFGSKWQPSQVYLANGDDLDVASLRDFFGCPVTLKAPVSGLRFPIACLQAAPRTTLYSGSQQQETLSAFLHDLESLAELISHTILSLLQTGDANLPTIARCFNLHPRVLQNRLKEAGLSFSELLQQARNQQAQLLLRETSLPITEIALQLDYAETAVFSRAFKKWNGVSPAQWRRQNRVHSPS